MFAIVAGGVDPIVAIEERADVSGRGPAAGDRAGAPWPGDLDPIDDVFAPLGDAEPPARTADLPRSEQLLDRG